MLGLMQDAQLLTSQTLAHAAKVYPNVEIATALDGRVINRSSYAEVDKRARRLASSLTKIGLAGDDVFLGALAWNTQRLFEVMHGAPGAGAVLHTANPRLHPEHLAYTINHCGDRVIFVDTDCLLLAEEIAPACKDVQYWILMAEPAQIPKTTLPNVISYEDLIDEGDPEFIWPEFDERRASTICFTSATTGDPKGVLYTHRGTILNVLTTVARNGWGLGRGDVVLCTAAFFHCNGWGMPFMAPLSGASMVLPGRNLNSRVMLDLIRKEGVTHSGGVPTVLIDLLSEAKKDGLGFGKLRQLWTGATAPSEVLLRSLEELGPKVIHAFGMTETTQSVTVSIPDPHSSERARRAEQLTQGQPIFLSDVRAVDEVGRVLPSDGKSIGHLQVRGPAVAAGYFGRPDINPMSEDGWLDTGDIGSVGPEGHMRISDRSKDAIKSGGEWISSVNIENIVAGCPGVAEACCIGVPHPRWQERPLLLIVREPGKDLDQETVLSYLDGRIAKWQKPDAIRFVDSLPRNGVGKLVKDQLRKDYQDVLL